MSERIAEAARLNGLYERVKVGCKIVRKFCETCPSPHQCAEENECIGPENFKVPNVKKTQHWSVTATRNGHEVVTIESNSLSGNGIGREEEKIIRMAAENLLSFIGGVSRAYDAGYDDHAGAVRTRLWNRISANAPDSKD